MKTLTVCPSNKDQEKARKMFPDAINVSYKHEPEADATEYLMSSPAMVEHLNKSKRG